MGNSNSTSNTTNVTTHKGIPIHLINTSDDIMTYTLAVVIWRDCKTGLEYIGDPQNPRDAVENCDKYRIYVSDNHLNDVVEIKVLPIKETVIEDAVVDLESVNTDNSAADMLELVSVSLYQQSLKLDTTKDYCKIYDSICHRGLINTVFDYTNTSWMSKVRSDIEILGSNTDLDLDKIRVLNDNVFVYDSIRSTSFLTKTIYKNGHTPWYVRGISDYCQTMFGINRYNVAKLFEKNDPIIFIDYASSISSDVVKHHCMFMAGCIHAELDNYEEALTMFEEANSLFSNDYIADFITEVENFKEYYEKHGTSILSSN